MCFEVDSSEGIAYVVYISCIYCVFIVHIILEILPFYLNVLVVLKYYPGWNKKASKLV